MNARSITSREAYFIVITILTIVLALTSWNCKTRKEREAEQAHLDSLYRDSTKAFNPYKLGQGTNQYNNQREALGDINKLTTSPQPAVPERK